jgi:hypothetical protein
LQFLGCGQDTIAGPRFWQRLFRTICVAIYIAEPTKVLIRPELYLYLWGKIYQMSAYNNYPKALINQSELDNISKWVLDYPNIETGGDFFGFWSKEGYPVIQYVIGPGKNTTRTSTSFYQDIPYLRECGAFLNSKFGLEHIGGWHSHHQLSLNHPSGGDINTMRNALRDNSLPRFLISICNIERSSKVSINGFIFSRNGPDDYIPCNWQVLEGVSPIREKIEKLGVSIFTTPSSQKAAIDIERKTPPVAPINQAEVEKPDLADDSYWKKPEGRAFLKRFVEHYQNRSDVSDVEISQLPDKRIMVSMKHANNIYELRFPNDYPKGKIEMITKRDGTDNSNSIPVRIKKMWQSEKKMDKFILDFLKSNGFFDDVSTKHL